MVAHCGAEAIQPYIRGVFTVVWIGEEVVREIRRRIFINSQPIGGHNLNKHGVCTVSVEV